MDARCPGCRTLASSQDRWNHDPHGGPQPYTGYRARQQAYRSPQARGQAADDNAFPASPQVDRQQAYLGGLRVVRRLWNSSVPDGVMAQNGGPARFVEVKSLTFGTPRQMSNNVAHVAAQLKHRRDQLPGRPAQEVWMDASGQHLPAHLRAEFADRLGALVPDVRVSWHNLS